MKQIINKNPDTAQSAVEKDLTKKYKNGVLTIDEYKEGISRLDFIFDVYQIYEGALNGASAALIIVSILDEKELNQLIKTCKDLSITPLVEIFNEYELHLALNNGADVIGINNRNLNNLETSLKVFEELSPMVPKDKILISESGIKTIEDVELMSEQGADGVLVGESILKSKNIIDHIKKLSNVKKCK